MPDVIEVLPDYDRPESEEERLERKILRSRREAAARAASRAARMHEAEKGPTT